jgi:hypothetical protein
MGNGALFETWTPFNLKREEARKLILETANGDYDSVYESSDIEALWRTIG